MTEVDVEEIALQRQHNRPQVTQGISKSVYQIRTFSVIMTLSLCRSPIPSTCVATQEPAQEFTKFASVLSAEERFAPCHTIFGTHTFIHTEFLVGTVFGTQPTLVGVLVPDAHRTPSHFLDDVRTSIRVEHAFDKSASRAKYQAQART